MRDGLYSIGEVCRLKGLTPKMLRYYDEIDVFKPTFVDAETGYRYYAPEQLTELDILRLAISSGISLKELAADRKRRDSVDARYFLKRSRDALQRSLRDISLKLTCVNDYLAELDGEGAFPENGPGIMGEVWALAAEWTEGGFKPEAYLKVMTELSQQAREMNLAPMFNRGLLFLQSSGAAFAFLEIASDDGINPSPELQPLPAGAFEGLRIEGPSLVEAFNRGWQVVHERKREGNEGAPDLVTLTELWGSIGSGTLPRAMLRFHPQPSRQQTASTDFRCGKRAS